MSFDEVQQKMSCRRCGRPRIITRVSKPKTDMVKLYMRCPVHTSEVVYRMPLNQYDAVSGIIREHVLLCQKCGQPVDITGQRAGKLSTKVRILCPEHGEGERLVNNSLLDPLLTAVPAKVAPEAAVPAGSSRFCSSCGSPVPTPEAQFCHNCGASID